MNQAENQWKRLAQKTAARLRVGTILQVSIPPAVVSGFALLGLGISSRMNGLEREWILLMVGAFVFFGSVVMLLGIAPRSKSCLILAAYAHLDSVLGMNCALSAAATGHGQWPALPANSDDLLRFNWKRILPPYILCVLLILAGVLIPLPAAGLAAGKIPPPRSHEEIAALISELQGVEALRKDDLEKLQQQLDEIRNQPAENWFSHSSLEASDHLQKGLQEKVRALESGLNKAVSSLAALKNPDESMTSAEQQRLAGEFKATLEGLKKASPGFNEKLMDSLFGINPANLESLLSGEFEQMLEQLKAAAKVCKNCHGGGWEGKNRGNGEAQSELDDLLQFGEDARHGQQEGSGRGGIHRGPGVAALPLSRNPTDLATDKPEFLQTEDFSRARPGDVIGTAATEQKLDKSPVGSRAGGSATAGQGGEAVSRDALVPSEKAILRSYFR